MELASLYEIYLRHPRIQTDTRKLRKGDLFFALKGPNFNGNEFALPALENGAAYVVVDETPGVEDERIIEVPDVLTTLQQLASYHRLKLDIPILAITGSNGKTTTKELVTAGLRTRFCTYATEGNLNNHIGVPLTILRIGSDAELAVIEMGANHQKEIASYCEIARPTHGLITNCGKAHIEGFGGEEGVRKGKGELFEFLRDTGGLVFRNSELSYLATMAEGIAQQITYGTHNAHIPGRIIGANPFLEVAVLKSGAECTIRTQLVGDYNFPNVMAAVAVGLHFGVSIDSLRAAIENYQPDNSRSQFVDRGGNKVILDAYNANPTSMRAAISNFAAQSMPEKMLWIGAMKEMGEDEVREHQELVDFIQNFRWSDVILVGKEFEHIRHPFTWYCDSGAAAAEIKKQQLTGASILIKGSRGSKMELMLEAI